MPTYIHPTSDHNFDYNTCWEELYRLLTPLTRTWAYHAGVPTWKGQEADFAEDILQMAMEKIYCYLEQARQQKIAIGSLTRLSIVIAKRCFLDLRRRDLRLRHFSHDDMEPGEHLLPSLNLLVESALEIEEKIDEEWALAASAQTIAAFSRKLRLAILVDLANRSSFDEEPSTLQRALLAAGIHLQDYQRAPSPERAERGRQSALRSLAYKRISQANVV